MKVGLHHRQTEHTIQPAEIAREAEARGYDSLFFGEHTNMPIHGTHQRAPGNPRGDALAEASKQLYSPLISLAAAGSVTTTLQLGTSVALIALRDPILFAKETATLDHLTSGRLVIGIGYGWNAAECANHGVDPHFRRKISREKMLAVRALWTQEPAEFAGEYVRIAPTVCLPQPVQKPGPPVVMGAKAEDRVFRHVIDFCDGWMARGYDDIEGGWARLGELAEASGRDRAQLTLMVAGNVRAEPDELERYRRLGVDCVLISMPDGKRDDVLRQLDLNQTAIGEFLG